MHLWSCFLAVAMVISPVIMEIPTNFKQVLHLKTRHEVEEFKNSPSITMVYYYKRDLPRLRSFFKELEKSAQYLDIYGVKMAVYDCTLATKNVEVADACGKEKVEQQVWTYRSGHDMLTLELETMFDVNSIMSNLLQLVMLREVPILQKKDELQKHMNKYTGKYDIIFGYMKAIGTHEHRVFMEVAYAYQDKFKFAICTDRKATAMLQSGPAATDQSSVWVIYTKDAEKDQDPQSLRYQGELTLQAFAKFTKILSLPKVYDIPEDGEDPATFLNDMDFCYLFYDKETEENVKNKAWFLHETFHGRLIIVTMDVSQGDIEGVSVPALALQLTALKGEQRFYDGKEWETVELIKFVNEALQGKMMPVADNKMDQKVAMEESSREEDLGEKPPEMNAEEVEDQDDQVAEVVYSTRNIPIELDLAPALTDKTFPTTMKNSKLVMVLFHLPFDTQSSALLRIFGEAASKLGEVSEGLTARVSCFDWTDVCASQNITAYPTIRVFKDGEKLADYKGALDSAAIYSAVKMLHLGHPIYLKKASEIQDFTLGTFPADTQTFANTTVLALFKMGDKSEKNAFLKVAGKIPDGIVYAYSDFNDAKKLASDKFSSDLPLIILSKLNDDIEPQKMFDGDFTEEDISRFVQHNRWPRLPELTPLNFPALYQRKQPFVVLFTDDMEDSTFARSSLQEVVQDNVYSNLSYSVLPVPSKTGFAYKILETYTSEAPIPTLSYVHLQKGEVYNFNGAVFTSDKMSEWMKAVIAGDIEPSAVLERGEWKPLHKGYDFLAIMDWEKKHGRIGEEMLHSGADDVLGLEGRDVDGNKLYKDVAEPNSPDVAADIEIRQELHALRNSRLYQVHGRDKHSIDLNAEKAKKSEEKHVHVEL